MRVYLRRRAYFARWSILRLERLLGWHLLFTKLVLQSSYLSLEILDIISLAVQRHIALYSDLVIVGHLVKFICKLLDLLLLDFYE